jgi:hypothetical protein
MIKIDAAPWAGGPPSRGGWKPEPYKAIKHWKAAFEDLGAGGIGAVPAEPWNWDAEIRRVGAGAHERQR